VDFQRHARFITLTEGGRVRSLVGLLAATVIGLAGCNLTYTLTIYNVDRDPVRIFVNGKEVGRLTCTDPALILAPTHEKAAFHGI
jgi:hypothetical protein